MSGINNISESTTILNESCQSVSTRKSNRGTNNKQPCLEYPVLLLHAIMDGENNWFVLEKYLRSQACPNLNTAIVKNGHIENYKGEESIFKIHFMKEEEGILQCAEEVKAAVDAIQYETGCSKVNVIGFSTGALAGLWRFIENDDIHDLILFSPPLQGSPLIKIAQSWPFSLLYRTYSQNYGPKYGNKTWTLHLNPPSDVVIDLHPESDFIKALSKRLTELPPEKRGRITIFSGTKAASFSILIKGEDDGVIPFPRFPGNGVEIIPVHESHGGCRENEETVLPRVAKILTDFE